LLLWNLRAAGASVCLYDETQQDRLKPFVEAFLMPLHDYPIARAKQGQLLVTIGRVALGALVM
jgi:hypothetical protein